jgi:phosphonopyruvate decarboxylase
MIRPERLYQYLTEKDVSFFTGVPDSLLKHFLKYLQDHSGAGQHTITANEGLAVALASGYHFSTGKLPLVYLQNSGLGNIINPLTSLADREMYSVPMLLMIGWRGRPGTKDEPQHSKMGRITLPLLEALEIPYYILDEEEVSVFKKIDEAIAEAVNKQQPVALVVPEEIFTAYEGIVEPDDYSLLREHVIKELVTALQGNEMVVCTTGKIGREFYEQNYNQGKKISRYLLCAGAMGHASHIALGIQRKPGEKMIMLDGDGAVLMHMGSLATLGRHAGDGFIHIVINNGSHESVGGQPTEGFNIDLCGVARACGYQQTVCITREGELKLWLSKGFTGTQFAEIRTNKLSRANLGRPAGEPVDWKKDFMNASKK